MKSIKIFKKYIVLTLTLFLISSVLISCSNQEMTSETIALPAKTEATDEVGSASEEETERVIKIDTETETDDSDGKIKEPDERVEVDGMIRSFLTGEMVPVTQGNRRPLAVMMSNDKEARPQYGINRAGVVYEAPVEGTMNRYMALIEDYDDLERIGSVRSCRTYYVYFANEWDAIYAHYGQSTFAKPYLFSIDNINGLDGIGTTAFYRSKDKKSPHNAYTSGDRIKQSIEKLEYRTEYDEDYLNQDGHFKFAKEGEEIFFEEGLSLDAAKMYPGYSYNNPWFEYNSEDGLYHRYQYGDVHNGDEGPIAVKNVIFQYAPNGYYASTQYLNFELHGDSYGYYFTNGRVMPVSVKKDGQWGVTRYYDMEGNEITLNKGKTWICIIQSSKFDKTEIYDINGNKN